MGGESGEHVQNNYGVRGILRQRGIKPEDLPPAEDIKKVERRVAKEEKSMLKDAPKLPKKP
jgi:DNA-damage-inducible protein D